MPRPFNFRTNRNPSRSSSSSSSTPSATNESGSSGAAAPLLSFVMSAFSKSRWPASSSTRSSRGAPTRYANSSSSRAHVPWNVPIHAPSITCAPSSGRLRASSVVMRSRSSSAARSLKVTASMRSGGTPCSTSQQNRSVAVKVLPVPGPAAIKKAPSGPAWAAAACSGLNGTRLRPVRWQRSFGRSPAKRADRRMWAVREATDACAGEVARRGFEVPSLDARDRIDDDRAAAFEVVAAQGLLAVLLEASRLPDAEDHLANRAPDPLLRVPDRKEPRLESERMSVVVETEAASKVVEGELNVVQRRPEVGLIGIPHRLTSSGLVVDDLDLAVTDIVDAVDFPDDLRSVQLEMEAAFQSQRAQPSNALQASREADVVAEQIPHLAFFALAIEHALHAREISIEASLQGFLEPDALSIRFQRPPLRLVGVELLENFVQEAPTLHRH